MLNNDCHIWSAAFPLPGVDETAAALQVSELLYRVNP